MSPSAFSRSPLPMFTVAGVFTVLRANAPLNPTADACVASVRAAKFDVWLAVTVVLPLKIRYSVPLELSNSATVVTSSSVVALPAAPVTMPPLPLVAVAVLVLVPVAMTLSAPMRAASVTSPSST
jgi:hypothetical protein